MAHPAAKKALADIRDAGDRERAEKAIKPFPGPIRGKRPEVVAKVVDDGQLSPSTTFPAEHWVHLKTSNPSEFILVAGRGCGPR